MTHTPGPWKALLPRFGYQIVRQDPKDWDGHGYQHICSVPQSGKGTHYGEMFQANARLIAAAPDMLAALKAVEQWWLTEEMGNRICAPYAIFATRAAITKVEGDTAGAAK